MGAAEESGIARSPWRVVWIRQDHGWREEDRLDLISDRSGGVGVPSMQETEADEEEPIASKAADGATAPPDNIPFWKSDFSAVLAIFAASFLPSLSLLPVRSYVRSISSLALSAQYVIQVILLIPRRLPPPL